MNKKQRWLALLGVITLFGLFAASAQAQSGTRESDAQWQVRYYNNITLTGSPVVSRLENDPAYDAVSTNFAPGVAPDNFSARFEKYVDVQAGTYRFTVTADDGVRISVDGTLVLDAWKEQGPTTYTRDVSLTAGFHLITLDYYDKSQFATLKYSFGAAPLTTRATPTPVNSGWKAEFFNNTALSGAPDATYYYDELNFDWGINAPAQRLLADNFSARFSRTLNLAPGTWRFNLSFDDGARLYINDQLLINRWTAGAYRTYYYELYLPGGATNVRVEYFELTERAAVRLAVQNMSAPTPTAVQPTRVPPTPTSPPTRVPPTPTAPPIPSATPIPGEVVVDDSSPDFIMGGPPAGFRTENEGYDGGLTWTQNNEVQQADYNYARWYPKLDARRYEVLVYIPARFTTTTAARYYVSHRDGLAQVVVSQSQASGSWRSLGTYTFTGTRGDYVSLSDITGEPALTTLVAFDAVRFVPR